LFIIDGIQFKSAGRFLKKQKVGVILGGGGARGLAHIGVIEMLEKENIPIDIITGSSIGALIGGLFAQNPDASFMRSKVEGFIKGPKFKELGVNNFRQKKIKDPDDILSQLAHEVKRRIVINLAAHRKSLLKFERLKLAVDNLLEDTNIENCDIPFACIAADLISGEEVIFQSGNIRKAVESSSAIPGFIQPVEYNGKQLVDGSVINNFPIQPAIDLGAELTIVVNVSLQFEENTEINNVVDIVMRSSQITSKKLHDHLKNHADIIISPEIGDIHWSEFTRIDEIIEKGRSAATEILPEVKKRLYKRSGILKKWFT
jgi:NTE family protein